MRKQDHAWARTYDTLMYVCGGQYLKPDPVIVSLVPPAVLPLLGQISVTRGVSNTVYVKGVMDWDKSFPLTTLTSHACSGPLPRRRESNWGQFCHQTLIHPQNSQTFSIISSFSWNHLQYTQAGCQVIRISSNNQKHHKVHVHYQRGKNPLDPPLNLLLQTILQIFLRGVPAREDPTLQIRAGKEEELLRHAHDCNEEWQLEASVRQKKHRHLVWKCAKKQQSWYPDNPKTSMNLGSTAVFL